MDDKTYLHVDLNVIKEVGQTAARVLAILSEACDNDGTISMTHAEIAKKAGFSQSSARRAIDTLRNAGWLKSEPQYGDNRQCANLYRLLHGGQIVPPAQNEQGNTSTNTSESSSISKPLVLKRNETEVVPVPAIPEFSGALRAPCTGTPPTEEQIPASGGVSQVVVEGREIIWPSPDSPMPVRSPEKFGFPNVFDLHREALWLVAYFERLVLEHNNRYRQALGKEPKETIGDSRKRKYLQSAEVWLRQPDAPTLDEICAVTRWVFTECGGEIPFEAINPWSHEDDRNLTNIHKLYLHYDRLREAMAEQHTEPATDAPIPPSSQPIATPANVLADVDELVQQYVVDLRRRNASDALRRNLSDTFLFMLTRDKIDPEDIRLVLANLLWAGPQCGIDVDRYRETAFPLRPDFTRLHQCVVKALKEREHRALSGFARAEDVL